MTDEWFDEYVFQIAAPRDFVDHDLLDIYDNAQRHVLPMWDTLGALRSHIQTYDLCILTFT